MQDTTNEETTYADLFSLASEQHGYFTTAQALAHRMSWRLLTHHTKQGRFIRIRRGLYRFRDYPSFPREDVVAAWLAVGKDVAVVSHESALELFDLSDVIPNAVHLTVPRTKRRLTALPGVSIHTTTKPPGPRDVVMRQGIRMTSPTRTILDSAEWGTGPEQIEMAAQQALNRGLALPEDFLSCAPRRGGTVYRLVSRAVEQWEESKSSWS